MKSISKLCKRLRESVVVHRLPVYEIVPVQRGITGLKDSVEEIWACRFLCAVCVAICFLVMQQVSIYKCDTIEQLATTMTKLNALSRRYAILDNRLTLEAKIDNVSRKETPLK